MWHNNCFSAYIIIFWLEFSVLSISCERRWEEMREAVSWVWFLDFETKVVTRSMILDLHVNTHTQCILVYCTFGIYRALRLSDTRTTGPSDCRTLGLLGTRSVGTLGIMGGHRWISCTNHCFPRGRTAGKLNFSREFKHHIYILTVMWP